MELLEKLARKGLIDPPSFVISNIIYAAKTGSVVYGASTGSSDLDIVGIFIGPRSNYSSDAAGIVIGFDSIKRFEHYQKHHIPNPDDEGEIDVALYDLAKYVRLAADCNPNIIELLYVSFKYILHNTPLGHMLRSERRLFLSKRCYDTFHGYALSQLREARTKVVNRWVALTRKLGLDPLNVPTIEAIVQMDLPPKAKAELIRLRKAMGTNAGKRIATIAKYGWDTKFGYHIVRLLLEGEQILSEGTLDLKRNAELLRAIRNGAWTLEDVEAFFEAKEKELENLRDQSDLPPQPDRDAIRSLLKRILNHHYENLFVENDPRDALRKIEEGLNELKAILETKRPR